MLFKKKIHPYENYPAIILIIIGVAIAFSTINNNSLNDNPIQPQLSGVCIDSDGRDAFSSSGSMRIGSEIYQDRCIDSITVLDYYCYGNALYTTKICSYTCFEGRCLTLEMAKTYCGNGVTEHFEECDYNNPSDTETLSRSCENDCRISS